MRTQLILAALLTTIATTSWAVTLTIGDVDGFGISPTTGLVSAHGAPADTNANGIIEPGEFLPSWDRNNSVATGSHDDFDLRSAAEMGSTTGAQWTDVSLSTSFASRPGLAKDVSFSFSFAVPTVGDADYNLDHFINFVFGDYDVYPMTADVDGQELTFTIQSQGVLDDGLVKIAYAAIPWADMLDGQVVIDIIAPNEPYVAFDYALLDTRPLQQNPVPEPGTLILLGSGLLGLASYGRKHRK